MISVRFFASLRETLGTPEHELAKTSEITSVADVVEALVRVNGEQWREALLKGQTLVAVNQGMADFATELSDGDEVAFFPPVTGG